MAILRRWKEWWLIALTRKFLNALGIESEKQDEIIDQHTVTLNEIKSERDTLKADLAKYKADAEKLSSTEEKLSEVQKELDELKRSDEKDGYKEKYDALKNEFDQYKKDIESKAATEKKTSVFKKYLKDAKIPEKRFDAIIKLSEDEINKIEFDEEGNEKDSESIKKSIEENWSDYIVTSGKEGANTATPPANNGGEENSKSRAAKIAEKYHNELYGNGKEE